MKLHLEIIHSHIFNHFYLSHTLTNVAPLTQEGEGGGGGGGWRGGNLRDGLYHVQPHLHTAVGVVGPRLRQPRHTVVAVSQDLDPQTVVLLSQKSNSNVQQLIIYRGGLHNDFTFTFPPLDTVNSTACSIHTP